jgi:hypothetical protein
MGQLNNLYVSSSYQGLLKMTDSANGLTNTLQVVQTGDGDNSPLQMSLTQVNISGSFTVNGASVIGTSGTSGTSGRGFNWLGNWSGTTSYQVDDVVYFNGSSYVAIIANTNKIPSIEVTYWSIFTQAGTNGTSGTNGSSGSSGSNGSSGTSGSNGTDGSSGSNGTDGSSGTSGTDGTSGSNGTDGTSGSNGTDGTSGTDGSSGSNGTDGTSGSNGTDGTSGSNGTDGSSGSSGTDGTSGSNGTDGSSGTSGLTDKTGLITTGSIAETQSITGSLIESGSLSVIGFTNMSGSLWIKKSDNTNVNYVTESGVQSNIYFGQTQNSSTLSGSYVVSGSNNLLLSQLSFSPTTIGYINGSSNIGLGSQISMNTSSLLQPTTNNNNINSSVALTFTTSSLGQSIISTNIINASQTFNHPSSSLAMSNNVLNASVTSTSNLTTHTVRPTFNNNIVTAGIALNQFSSSILTTNNILGGGLTVNNSYFQTGSNNNITLANNIFGGQTTVINVAGNPQTNVARPIVGNLIGGSGNSVSAQITGSDLGGLRNTAIWGHNLVVTGSHSAATTTQQGAAFFGRWNSEADGLADSARTVFAVGTGTATGASRKTALYITSGSIVGVSGSLLVQGSSTLSGSMLISGSINNMNFWRGPNDNASSLGIGLNALNLSISGSQNVAIGASSLATNVSGSSNVAIGASSLQSNKGSSNIAIGFNTMVNNTIGAGNTAIGVSSLNTNVSGSNNIAIGYFSLQSNTSDNNLGIGYSSLFSNTTGQGNTAIGANSTMFNNTTGDHNTVIGNAALSSNVSGSGNISIGRVSGIGETGDNNLYINSIAFVGVDNSRSGSIIYGKMNSTTANQTLQINAATDIRFGLKVQGTSTLSGSLNINGNTSITGNTQMSGNGGFPLTIDGTITSKRFSFAGNPFNSNIGGTFGSLNYDSNNITLQYANGDFGTPATSSFNNLTTNTGSNITQVNAGASYAGTTAQTNIINNNGARSFVVDVDSTTISGSLTVTGSLSVGGNLQFNVGDFYSTQTQSGSANVSGSVTYNNTGISNGVTLASNSRLTIANSGVYSITFSAQLKEIGGTDTIYLWLKKNGTNVADTGTKTVVRNNDENIMTVEYIVQAAANDYYEIVFQNVNGHAQLFYEAASGNIPATPSIITTVKQVR